METKFAKGFASALWRQSDTIANTQHIKSQWNGNKIQPSVMRAAFETINNTFTAIKQTILL